MVLVAISLVSLLAMAALAIDVVTLYVARSEIQRAADAAALAGAKAVADSGVTTLPPGDSNLAAATTLARTMAASAVTAMLNANPPINQVAGQTITPSTSVTFPGTANPTNSNPYVTVTLKVTTLPTFFSKIWGNRAATVSATAAAEAYNPANVQNFVPIAPKGVKPWLIANSDPNNFGLPFVSLATGVIETIGGGSVSGSVIGETLNLTADCTAPNCTLIDNPPKSKANLQVDYVPALITANTGANVCPSACTGANPYEQSIECADLSTSYQTLSCGGSGGTNTVTWDNGTNPGGLGGLSDLGTECLIHATAAGRNKGQDLLNPGPWPDNPMQITAQSGAQNGNLVTTSNSIVTIPIVDVTPPFPASGSALTVVGFLQGFINEVHRNGPSAGDIEVTVLNIAGCGSASTKLAAAPITGAAGTSPVPVRLITPP